MSQLIINKPEDLAKLIGWTIDGVQVAVGSNPVITLQIHHLAAEYPVKLHITGDVSFGRSGNVMIVNSIFTLKTEDVVG